MHLARHVFSECISVCVCFKIISVSSICVVMDVLCFASGFGLIGITAGFIITSFHTSHFETEDSNSNLSRVKR